MKILIVEDEALLAMSYMMALEGGDCKVVGVARDAEEAVAMAAAEKPDIVLMDIKLPGGHDGVDAAREIIERFNIPIVYITSNTDEATRQRAIKTGPKAYLEKPVDCEKLHRYICLNLTDATY